ncbi:hypothetical protein [Burkholderia vietnamiensis]|uniref:hypothetical protein n=1 Tax=Burkholderia vietnamiensis TaxID=60552 RepID=UPI0012D96DD4|nr:hypothetical protein [Burkholderia vietnamiensis]
MFDNHVGGPLIGRAAIADMGDYDAMPLADSEPLRSRSDPKHMCSATSMKWRGKQLLCIRSTSIDACERIARADGNIAGGTALRL